MVGGTLLQSVLWLGPTASIGAASLKEKQTGKPTRFWGVPFSHHFRFLLERRRAGSSKGLARPSERFAGGRVVTGQAHTQQELLEGYRSQKMMLGVTPG